MVSGGAALVLTTFPGKDRVLLVRATDAIRLCRGGGYEALPAHRAFSSGAAQGRAFVPSVRQFLAEVQVGLRVSRLDDAALLDRLHKLVRAGEVVAVRATESESGEASSATVKLRRLARAATGGALLKLEGRSFRLVAGDDLDRVRDRDDYNVVPQAEAQRVLVQVAATVPATQATALNEAGKRLTKDWRPPFQPDGLVLLKKIALPKAATKLPDLVGAARRATATEAAPEEAAVVEEVCRPCADLAQAKQAAALAQAAQAGLPFCEECSNPDARAA